MIASQVHSIRGGFSWYLVIAKRGKETLARENLSRQGFEVYLPMHAPTRPAREGAAPIPRPFLPGYLFVSVDLNSPGWRKVYSTFGVQTVYTTGSGDGARPRAIPNRWVEQLQEREVNGLVMMAPKEEAGDLGVEAGAPVHLAIGSASINALFVERVDAKRVAILVSLLGRESRQVVAIDDVEELAHRRTSNRGSVR